MNKRMVPGILAALLVGMLVAGPQGVLATHTPADKVVAAGSKMEVVGPGEEIELLSSRLRTSKPADLILSVSLECSILTKLITGPSGDGAADSAMARGQVLVWVEIDGAIVPINSGQGGTENDKVTFCDRVYERTVTDTEDPLDGQDTEEDYIRTKAANAFNWLHLNTGSGIHEIVVKATLTTNTAGDAAAEALVGNRTLIVEPTKLANDASV
jgi:hypothetical protein